MHTYVASSGDRQVVGGLGQCIAWASALVGRNQSRVVRILKIRAGERRGRVVGEVTADGVRLIRGGRVCHARAIRKAAHGG